jgi:hypothetical protein
MAVQTRLRDWGLSLTFFCSSQKLLRGQKLGSKQYLEWSTAPGKL